MLELRNIEFSYGRAPLIAGLSLKVGCGDFAVLRGESGCGKSTLLRLLCRLEAPQDGVMLFGGEPYESIPARALRRRLAFLQQLPVMIDGSIRDNLLLSTRYSDGGGKAAGDDEMRSFLHRARLAGTSLDASSMELSVGQKQRIALVRLVLMNPDMFLLDEPTAALDAESTAVILNWISELHKAGKTIFMVSHIGNDSIPAEARLLRMENGMIKENE